MREESDGLSLRPTTGHSDDDGDDDDVDLFCSPSMEGELSEDELPDEPPAEPRAPYTLKEMRALVVVDTPPGSPRPSAPPTPRTPERRRGTSWKALEDMIEMFGEPAVSEGYVVVEDSPLKPAAGGRTVVESSQAVAGAEAPVESTQPLVESTQALPVESTEALVDSTQALVESTQAPVESTAQPVESTQSAVESTQAPVESTQALVESTQAPVESTQAPVESTQAPVDGTAPFLDKGASLESLDADEDSQVPKKKPEKRARFMCDCGEPANKCRCEEAIKLKQKVASLKKIVAARTVV